MSYLFPVIAFLLFIKNKGKIFPKVLPLLIYSIVFFLTTFFFDQITPSPVSPRIFNFLFTLTEYILFATLLTYWYQTNKTFLKTVFIGSIFFLLFHTFYSLWVKAGLIDSVSIGICTLLMFAYIFYYIFLELNRDETKMPGMSLATQPTFWIALGILVYLAGTFFFHLLIDYLPKEQIRQYWFITYIFDIIKNIFFTIAIFVYIRQANKKPQAQKTNEPFLNFL
ncbi:hypothetical protein ACFS6H_01025 [Terrimonas rubra]|uniref:YhhN-like protein n=1 Tax=Terrimonas rubra TaxID=1035890 RepID=A0ABW5ZZ18_9BACT